MGKGARVGMNLDAYYRGLAAERLQSLGDELSNLAQEAQGAEAVQAAMELSDLSTQLLDLGVSVRYGGHEPGE